MDVTPQLLHDVEFREAKRGGYNTQDVDEFLERLAVGIERQDAQLREVRQRAEAVEARLADAERRAAEAERRAGETSDADETLKRTLVLAQRTADAAIREAEEQAAATLSSAQEQSSRMLAEAQEATARARAEAEEEARRANEDARERVLAELRELESARDQVRHDVNALEGHLAEQRDRLRLAVRELQRLLDDPDALREVAVPVVSEVTAPVEQAPLPPAPSFVPEPEPAPEPARDDPSSWTPDEEAWPEGDDDLAAEPATQDQGPPTEAVDMLAERDAGDDAYLAELRKAMTDDAPLGPRDDTGEDMLFERGADAGRSRFGRRR
jgi:cell division initiation protein